MPERRFQVAYKGRLYGCNEERRPRGDAPNEETAERWIRIDGVGEIRDSSADGTADTQELALQVLAQADRDDELPVQIPCYIPWFPFGRDRRPAVFRAVLAELAPRPKPSRNDGPTAARLTERTLSLFASLGEGKEVSFERHTLRNAAPARLTPFSPDAQLKLYFSDWLRGAIKLALALWVVLLVVNAICTGETMDPAWLGLSLGVVVLIVGVAALLRLRTVKATTIPDARRLELWDSDDHVLVLYLRAQVVEHVMTALTRAGVLFSKDSDLPQKARNLSGRAGEHYDQGQYAHAESEYKQALDAAQKARLAEAGAGGAAPPVISAGMQELVDRYLDATAKRMAAEGPGARMSNAGVGGLRNHHYFFAHVLLRNMFFRDPEKTMEALKSPQEGLYFLRDVFARSTQQFDTQLDIEGLGLLRPAIPTEWRVAIIKLPEPKAITEAYFVGLMLKPGGSGGPQVRFFTLEYHKPGLAVCGGWGRDGGHQNHGDCIPPDPSLFATWILQHA